MQTKHCRGCIRDLPISSFNANKTKPDGLQSHCVECTRLRNRRHYESRKDYYYDRNQKRVEEISKIYQQIKSELVCRICGEDEPVCIDFHHVNSEDKDNSVAKMVTARCSIKRIKQEIAKCVPLCSNCHRKVHAGLLVAPSGFEPETQC